MESDSFVVTLRRVYRRWQEGDGRSGVRMRMGKMTRYRSQLNPDELFRKRETETKSGFVGIDIPILSRILRDARAVSNNCRPWRNV
jgi:hypothetical protein